MEARFRRFLLAFISLSALSMPAWCFEEFQVSDIRVEGLQRISPGTVFNFLPVQVGDTFSEYESELTIRALFKSGYFKNISLEQEGTVLVVLVTPRIPGQRPAADALRPRYCLQLVVQGYSQIGLCSAVVVGVVE